MAALLVVLGAGNPPREEDLRRVLAAMAVLGPDGASTFLSGPVGLAHGAFIATPDPSGTHGFFRHPSADLAVAADVRLDDREELLDALGIPPAEGAGRGDAELLLRAYGKWEEGFLDRVAGDFTLLLWDGPRGRLLLARDAYGSRPLYWLEAGGVFAAASSARALLRLGPVAPRLREARIADALVDVREFGDPGESMWEGIHRLPAAHLMVVGSGGRRERKYWDLGAAAAALPGVRGAEALEGFRERFFRAVKGRLRAVPAAGSMLSGGLDSGSIVVAARAILRGVGGAPLRTFSCVSDDEAACCEAPFLRAVLAGGDLAPRLLRETEATRFLPGIRRLSGEFEEPFEAGILPVPLLMFLLARESGVRILLDGVDGDLAVSLNEECMDHAAAEGRFGLAWSLARGFGRFYGTSPLGLYARLILRRAAPPSLKAVWRRLRGVDGPGEAMDGTLVDRDLARRVDLRGRVAGVLAAMAGEGGVGGAAPPPPAGRGAGAHPHGPPRGRDGRGGGGGGVEARHPFADRRLAEFTVRVDYEEKVQGGWRKSLLRRGLEDLLPPPLRARRVDPVNLNPPFMTALLRAEGEGLTGRVEEALGATEGWVDGGRARALLREFREGGETGAAPELGRLLLLGDWLAGARAEGRG